MLKPFRLIAEKMTVRKGAVLPHPAQRHREAPITKVRQAAPDGARPGTVCDENSRFSVRPLPACAKLLCRFEANTCGRNPSTLLLNSGVYTLVSRGYSTCPMSEPEDKKSKQENFSNPPPPQRRQRDLNETIANEKQTPRPNITVTDTDAPPPRKKNE